MFRGLVAVVDATTVLAIVNIGDDVVLHGLHISPDLDTVTYTLAGAINPETRLGPGRRDVAGDGAARALRQRTHVVPPRRPRPRHPPLPHRTGCAEGAPLSAVTAEIAAAWELRVRLLPMTDDRVAHAGRPSTARARSASRSTSSAGSTPCAVRAVRFDGADEARPARGSLEAHRRAAERRDRAVEPDRVDRPGARGARRPRRGRRSDGPTRWRCRRSSPAPRSRDPPTGCSPSSATSRRSSAWPGCTRRCAGTLVIDEADAALARRGRGRGHALRRRPDRDGGARDAAALAACARRGGRGLVPGRELEIIGVEGIREVRPGDDLAGLIAAADAPACATATCSSSPRRSCRRPRGGWSRSTPTIRVRHKPLVERESVRVAAPPRRSHHQRDQARLRLRERRRRPVQRRSGAGPRSLPDDSDRSARRIRDGSGPGRRRGGRDRVRHVRAHVAARPHRRGHRLRRHRAPSSTCAAPTDASAGRCRSPRWPSSTSSRRQPSS